MAHEYPSLACAARSIAYKNGVPLDVAMLWARQAVSDGAIVISKIDACIVN